MAQYPVETGSGVTDALNYLLSGPAGLGQNFAGFSAYEPAYLSGTFRQPFTQAISTTTTAPSWYVAPVAVSTVTALNLVGGKSQNLQFTFATPQATPPFRVGQRAYGTNAWAPNFYQGNDGYVVSCSTTTLITQFDNLLVIPPVTALGSMFLNNDGRLMSTDANARVTVTGPTELVFINSQLSLKSGYSCTTTSSFSVTVQINRYVGSIDTAGQGAIDYLFNLDKTVSQQTQVFSVSSGTGTANCGQNIFTTVLDQPSFGYYWYICEVLWETAPTIRYDNQENLITGNLYDGTWSGTSVGTTSTYAGLTPVNISSAGSGGTVDVEIKTTQPNYIDSAVVTLNGDGSGYSVGDTLKILGTSLGGASPANDLYITVNTVGLSGDAVPTVQTVGLRSLTAQVIKQ